MDRGFESLLGQLEALFRDAAQDDVDRALAHWYLNRHVANNLSDALKQKALALHRGHSLEMLGNLAHRLGQREQAKQHYLEFGYAQLSDWRRFHRAFDYVLRHGTRAETMALATAFSRHNGVPFDAVIQQFYDQYASLIDEILRTVPAGPGAEQSKLVTLVAWGDRFVLQLLEYSLPCLLAQGNLVRLARDFDTTLFIFTDGEGARQIESHHFYLQVAGVVRAKIVTLSPLLLDYAGKLFKGLYKFILSIFLTNIAQYAALEAGRRLRAGVITLHPDVLFTDGLLADVGSAATAGHAAVTWGGFRIYNSPGNFAYFDQAFRDRNRLLSIPYRELEKSLARLVPEPYFVHSRQFSHFPLAVCWKTGETGFVAHINHYSAMYVSGAHLTREIEPTLDPFDGFFLSRYLDDAESIRIVTDHTGVSFEPNPLVQAPAPGVESVFRYTKVARWLRPFLTPVHARYFRQRRVFGLPEDEARDGANESSEAVEEILRLAARSDWI